MPRVDECQPIQFELFHCPNSDNHSDYRFTTWCEPQGTASSLCPECDTPGNDAQQDWRYGSTDPVTPWAPYRVLYQTGA
jgi:hypothetical protein